MKIHLVYTKAKENKKERLKSPGQRISEWEDNKMRIGPYRMSG